MVQANPDAKPFHTEVIEKWEDLVNIRGQDHTNGEELKQVPRVTNRLPKLRLPS